MRIGINIGNFNAKKQSGKDEKIFFNIFCRLILCAFATLRLCADCYATATPLPSATPTPHYTDLSVGETNKLLDKISARLGTVQSFQSKFIQERHSSIFEDVPTAKGYCYFQSPDKFRWELADPYLSILIFNRDSVAKFDVENNQLKFVESGAYKAMREIIRPMVGLMRGDFSGSRRMFDIRARAGNDYLIILTTQNKEMRQYIQTIEMTVEKNSLHVMRIVIREPEQDSIVINFIDVSENVSFDSHLFDLKEPSLKAQPPSKTQRRSE